ncbi:MAG: hypothetical protein M1812_000274 [Candelaria pacifica]|nr:MAG: hypothetical protein M1812_000274 [Candelaria pacifica]
MRTMITALLSVLLFAFSAQAQFQFFEQMFQGNQQQQQQQPQNVASDSSWYRQNYEAGNDTLKLSLELFKLAAQIIYAPAPSPASTSHTTAHAPFPIPRIR